MLPIKTLLRLSVFFCATQFASAQTRSAVDSSDFIVWNAQHRLSWSDYKYRPLNGKRYSGEIAITSVKISARGYIRKGIPDFQVRVYFVKSDSWTSDSTDMRLLRHEQLHFDIGEIYAEKIREKIVEMREEGITSPKRYRSAITNLITLFKSYSGQYDRDTSFGTIPERQQEWETRIARRIKEITSN